MKGALLGKKSERFRFGQETLEAEKTFAKFATAANEKELTRCRAKQHDYKWNVLTQSSFIVAHSLFGMSGSKRPTETRDDREVMKDLILVSANMLAQQPEAVRKQAVEETAEFIAKQPHVAQSKEQIATTINKKIDGLTQSGWLARTQQDKNGKAQLV